MSEFSKVASQVHNKLVRKLNIAASDKDAEWQRVNGSLADILKDCYMLNSKLSRVQADFKGEELDRLLKVSEAVMALGGELSEFFKAFYDGRLEMVEGGLQFGDESGGAPPMPAPSPEAAIQLFDKSGEAPEGGGEEEPTEGEEDSYDEESEEKPESQQQ
jgi:hypothetical protein